MSPTLLTILVAVLGFVERDLRRQFGGRGSVNAHQNGGVRARQISIVDHSDRTTGLADDRRADRTDHAASQQPASGAAHHDHGRLRGHLDQRR